MTEALFSGKATILRRTWSFDFGQNPTKYNGRLQCLVYSFTAACHQRVIKIQLPHFFSCIHVIHFYIHSVMKKTKTNLFKQGCCGSLLFSFIGLVLHTKLCKL